MFWGFLVPKSLLFTFWALREVRAVRAPQSGFLRMETYVFKGLRGSGLEVVDVS